MSAHLQRRERLRTHLSGQQCFYPASVFDPLSARIAEDLGYELGMLAGSVASMTVLGAPDLVTLTLTEFAEQAHRICRAGQLPLLVDADHGYGNALNVMRTIEELETAGVAGLSIEDTALPQVFGTKSALISIEEAERKLRAALKARTDSNLVIAGRTHVGLAGLENAITRIKRYQVTGVDAIFLVGVKTREQLETLTAATKLPVILGRIPDELMDLEYLSGQGVRICLQGHRPFMAAVQAVYETFKNLREGAPPQNAAASKTLISQLTREQDYGLWQRDYLQE